MPNYQGVWSLTTQMQNASAWPVPTVPARGLFFGGYNGSSNTTRIQYIAIQTLGNATDFGVLSRAMSQGAAVSSSTRGITAGGADHTGAAVNSIDYVTIASTGNSADFGDLNATSIQNSGVSNNTRGLISLSLEGGSSYTVNVDYVTIASTGNATDYGDKTTNFAYGADNGVSTSTRAIYGGGYISTGPSNVIQYATIASTGNFSDFGDLTQTRYGLTGVCSATRGVFMGGATYNVIDYITMASTGNATDFGDMIESNSYYGGGTSSPVRGVVGGGNITGTLTNRIAYITIASTGNAQDFGDLSEAITSVCACSDGHGGLQ
tara:strand:- start:3785 stop:4747 length:963 start_codon:yes stop_codon:yes gene_type:complete